MRGKDKEGTCAICSFTGACHKVAENTQIKLYSSKICKAILLLHLKPSSNESLFLTTSSEQESKLTVRRKAPVKLSFHLDQSSTLRPDL